MARRKWGLCGSLLCSRWTGRNVLLIVSSLAPLFLCLGLSGGEPPSPLQTAVPDASAPKTTLLSAMTNTQPTDAELTSLLKRVGERPENLERDAAGNIVFLALRGSNANDRALSVASNLRSLQELVIQGRMRPETGEWTREGIAQLHRLPNLEKLRVLCVGPEPSLNSEVFKEICSLRGLKSLVLVSSYPQQPDYILLTNLQNLAELHISWATNFGDAELSSLTNLPKLRNVYFACDAISREGTNVFRYMPGLTNASVYLPRVHP